jgi:4-hydroxy-2-oxoheptanedioate aldolase
MLNSIHPIDQRLASLLKTSPQIRGIFNTIPCPAIVEMCGYAGFEFIVIDNEHGSADFQTTENMLRAARSSGIIPIVRCFEKDIPRILDMGASGVQIPMVETPEQAQRLAKMIRYPMPNQAGGNRGSAFSPRAAGYGAFGGVEHTRISNESLALIVMIETPLGVENAASIAAVPGVDAVFVGPNDLAHTMGHENRWKDPEVEEAIIKVLEDVKAQGKCPGVLALSQEDQDFYAQHGARYFANVTTSIFTQALKVAAQFKSSSLSY